MRPKYESVRWIFADLNTIFSRILNWLISCKTAKFYATGHVRNFGQRYDRTSIARKICYVKSGQQNSLVHYFQKTNLKQGAHIHQPMIRLPRACRGRTAVQFPAKSSHMGWSCIELALKGTGSRYYICVGSDSSWLFLNQSEASYMQARKFT